MLGNYGIGYLLLEMKVTKNLTECLKRDRRFHCTPFSLLLFFCKRCAFQIVLCPKTEEPRICILQEQGKSVEIKWAKPIQSMVSLILFNIQISPTMLKLIPLADMEEYSSLSLSLSCEFPMILILFSSLLQYNEILGKGASKTVYERI